MAETTQQSTEPRGGWPARSRFKQSLIDGRPDQLVMYLTLNSVSVVEMLGASGVDAIILDLEHAPIGIQDVEAMIIAAEANGVSPLIRPARVDAAEISPLLDIGAAGILFPRLSSGDEAAAARACLHYQPTGTRGWGGSHVRSLRWVAPQGLRTRGYMDHAADSLLSAFLIETPGAVTHIEDVLDRGQPDAVFFGWGDYGVTVDFDPDALHEAGERVYAACRARGIGVALDPVTMDAEYYPGCFELAGVDSTVMAKAFRDHVAGLRANMTGQQSAS